jgi:hypothetical protein
VYCDGRRRTILSSSLRFFPNSQCCHMIKLMVSVLVCDLVLTHLIPTSRSRVYRYHGQCFVRSFGCYRIRGRAFEGVASECRSGASEGKTLTLQGPASSSLILCRPVQNEELEQVVAQRVLEIRGECGSVLFLAADLTLPLS